MSRSYRKTPICGMTSMGSDKLFKKVEDKCVRRAVNILDLSTDEPSANKEFGDPWRTAKDGK